VYIKGLELPSADLGKAPRAVQYRLAASLCTAVPFQIGWAGMGAPRRLDGVGLALAIALVYFLARRRGANGSKALPGC
jgi:hypothetical protein